MSILLIRQTCFSSTLTCLTHQHCRNTFGSYTCDCDNGWTGKHCTVDLNECLSGPCNTGSTCTNTQGSFSCVCPVGFTGKDCDQDFDECLTDICQHNATCTNTVGSFDCNCTEGFEGQTCSSCHGVNCPQNGQSHQIVFRHILKLLFFKVWVTQSID